MEGERKGGQKSQGERGKQKPLDDLEVRPGDVDKVKGGRRADPCAGGESLPQ